MFPSNLFRLIFVNNKKYEIKLLFMIHTFDFNKFDDISKVMSLFSTIEFYITGWYLISFNTSTKIS